MEAAAGRSAPRRGRTRARSTWRPAPATSRSRSRRAARASSGLDITLRMIELARGESAASGRGPACRVSRRRHAGAAVSVASFDIVTTGYGLRNVPDLAAAIDEIGRVLKPGGQAAVARLQPPVERASCGGLSGVPDGRRRRARLDAASRSGHVSLHSRVDSQLSGRRRRRAADGGARLHRTCATIRVLGGLMAIHQAQFRADMEIDTLEVVGRRRRSRSC